MSEERYPEQMDLCVKVSGETFGLLTDFANLLKVDAGEALGKVLRDFLEQQNAIAWHTSCINCAKLLDQLVQADQRWGKAEDKIVELQAKLRGMGAQHGM